MKSVCVQRGWKRNVITPAWSVYFRSWTQVSAMALSFSWIQDSILIPFASAGVTAGGPGSFPPTDILVSSSRNQACNPWSLILVHLLHVTAAVKKTLENCPSLARDKILINKNNLKPSLFYWKERSLALGCQEANIFQIRVILRGNQNKVYTETPAKWANNSI